MSVVNKFSKAVLNFTKKGDALVRKQTGIKISEFAKEGLQEFNAPKNATYYDAIKIGHKNNVDENFTDIFIFRDENGNIVKKITLKTEGQNQKQTVKMFEDLFPCDTEYDENIYLVGKKVVGYERENRKMTKCFEQTIAKTDTENPIITIFKRIIGDDVEINRLAQHEKGKKSKFFENTYQTYKYSDDFELVESKVSDERMKEISEHPYIYPMMAKYKKFIQKMFHAVDKDKRAILTPEIKTFKDPNGHSGYYSPYDNVMGTVYINKVDKHGHKRPRESLTRTIAHEYGHHDWGIKAESYKEYKEGLYTSLEEVGLTPDDIKLAEKYLKSHDNYIRPEENYREYERQFAERLPKVEGREAVERYRDLERKISEEFPNKHPNQIYPISNEGNESSEDFFTMIDSIMGEKRQEL